jgi:hypothetical protein
MRQVAVFTAMAADFQKLCVADAAIGDFDEDLAGLQGWDVKLDQFQRLAEFNQNGGGRLHESVRGHSSGRPISPDGMPTCKPNREGARQNALFCRRLPRLPTFAER